jgi:hypothetical protein
MVSAQTPPNLGVLEFFNECLQVCRCLVYWNSLELMDLFLVQVHHAIAAFDVSYKAILPPDFILLNISTIKPLVVNMKPTVYMFYTPKKN